MELKSEVAGERPSKRPKLQQSITSLFHSIGPRFVEAIGTQLVCPYCQRKFRAPQGLVAHRHMHERRGDVISRQTKIKFKKPSRSPPGRPRVLSKDPARAPLLQLSPVNVGVGPGNCSDKPILLPGKIPSTSSEHMTRDSR